MTPVALLVWAMCKRSRCRRENQYSRSVPPAENDNPRVVLRFKLDQVCRQVRNEHDLSRLIGTTSKRGQHALVCFQFAIRAPMMEMGVLISRRLGLIEV
jgi:hypothetical protein